MLLFFQHFLGLLILDARSGQNVVIDPTNVEYPSFSKLFLDFNRINKLKNISLKTNIKIILICYFLYIANVSSTCKVLATI